MPRVSTTPRVKIIWITGRDILMPCVPVTDSSRVVVRRGMVTVGGDRTTTWVRELESYRHLLEELLRG